MATKNRFQRLAMQAAKRAKAAAAVAGREANRLFKAARQRATDKRTQRKVKQSLQKTGRVLNAAGRAAAKAGRSEMRKGQRRPARRARR